MSGELALSITRADGSVKRWGAGEPDASDVPDDLSFSTSIPGGNKDCSCSLLRRVDLDYNDQGLFDLVRVYGPGNQTAWQGRMVQFPRDHGDSFGIQPAAVGMSAHLRDDPTFREVYVDRDMSKWDGPSATRDSALLAGTPRYVTSQGQVELVWDDTQPAIKHSFGTLDASAGSYTSACESWYRSPVPLYAVYYDTIPDGGMGSGWEAQVILATAEPAASGDTAVISAGAITAGFLTASANRRCVVINTYYTGTFSGATDDARWWRQLVVYGNHGLTRVGADPGGFYASDIIAHIVGRTAPMLRFTTGEDGSIQPTSFVIPHMVFDDPMTGEDAILAVNAYHLYDWGEYDGEFFYRQPDPDRLTWEARLSDGAKLSLEGDTAEQVFNGVYVTYPDATGVTKTVGPPGAIADATDPVLADTSDTNPVNAHGIPRRWGRLDLSITTTQAGATQLGYVWLQERALAGRRGQITLTGTVTHPTEGKVPVWRIRAGDWIKIADHPASEPRKVIETSYSHGSRSITLSVDNTAARIEAILERLGVLAIGRF